MRVKLCIFTALFVVTAVAVAAASNDADSLVNGREFRSLNQQTHRQRQLLKTVIFDDFEGGDPIAWVDYASDIGGGGIEISSSSVPPSVDSFYSLLVGFGGTSVGLWGGLRRTLTVALDITVADSFSFWIKPVRLTPTEIPNFTLQIVLQEMDGDELQYDCVVGATGPCAIIDEWNRLDIPLSSFVDGSFGVGEGVLTGPIQGIDISIVSSVITDAHFFLDSISFTGPDSLVATNELSSSPPTLMPISDSTTTNFTLSPTAALIPTFATTSPPTESPIQDITASSTSMDDGRIDCPNAIGNCGDYDFNCCLPEPNGVRPMTRIAPGERLEAGWWLCRNGFMFGLLHLGTVHVLRVDDDGRCTVLWTAEDGSVEGDYIEMDDEGNAGLYQIGQTGTPVWEIGCSMGKESRIKMVVLREDRPEAKVVLLRSFHDGRTGKHWDNERDWYVTRQGVEGVRHC